MTQHNASSHEGIVFYETPSVFAIRYAAENGGGFEVRQLWGRKEGRG
jgi:hypothetical protein